MRLDESPFVRLLIPAFAGLSTASLLAAHAAPAPKAAPKPVAIAAGLAEDTVEVKVNYSGARIVLFADSPEANKPDTGFAVALIGPSEPQKITRNTPGGAQHFRFVSAPSVFAIGAEPEASASPEVMAEAGLNVSAAALPASNYLNSPDLQTWRTAFVQLMVDRHLYSFDDAAIERLDGGLRRAKIDLPPNAPPGIYQVKAVVFRDGQKLGETTRQLTLVRGGADATLFDLSRKHGFVYGFLAILTALVVGGIASWIGRK
ncbi:MAG: hypothetical protein GC155_01540 [Alphaproteobacteria bacterium]|nr:hypothetical protein [Alphaproteobacteria bacterium]